jgi:hypothetical protein
MKHRCPLGSVPRRRTAWAGFTYWIGLRQSRAGPAVEKNGTRRYFEFKSFFKKINQQERIKIGEIIGNLRKM